MTIGWSMGQLIVDEGATSAIDYCTLADVEAYTGVDFSVTSITNIYTIDSAGIETALVQGRVRNTDEYWLHDSDAGIVRFMGKFSQDGVLALKAVYFAGNATPTIEAKMATIMMVARNAARSALNDENCMDRVKEMWARLLKSSESDMKEMLELVKRHSTIAVATFGMDGNY